MNSASCITYVPGEVLCLSKTQETEERGSRSFLGRSIEFFDWTLSLYYVDSGQELGFIHSLYQQAETIAAGLNYEISTSSQTKDAEGIESDAQPQKGFPVLLVFDVSEGHCSRVVEAAKNRLKGEKIQVLSFYLKTGVSNYAELYDFLELVARESQNLIGQEILAVNFSIDAGRLCQHGRVHSTSLQGVSFSFPVMDSVLEKLSEELCTETCRPAFFAAAGNNVRGRRLLRVSYPASHPSVISATSVRLDRDGVTFLQDIPCYLGIDIPVAMECNEGESTATSYASARAAAEYCKIAQKDRQLKVAFCSDKHTLLAKYCQSKIIAFKIDEDGFEETSESKFKLRIPILILGREPSKRSSLKPCELTNIIEAFGAFKKLFGGGRVCLFGSTATLIVWHAIYNRVHTPEAQPEGSDVDIIRLGSLLEDKGNILDQISIRERQGWGHLIKCGIPILSFLITESGLIDPYGGLEELRNGKISFFEPPEEVWALRKEPMFDNTGRTLELTEQAAKRFVAIRQRLSDTKHREIFTEMNIEEKRLQSLAAKAR